MKDKEYLISYVCQGMTGHSHRMQYVKTDDPKKWIKQESQKDAYLGHKYILVNFWDRVG